MNTLVSIFVFAGVLVAFVFLAYSKGSFGPHLHTISKGKIEVEVQSTRYKAGFKGRRGYWIGVGKTAEGEVWPVVRHDNIPHEVGSKIIVELRCTGGKLPHCQGFDVDEAIPLSD